MLDLININIAPCLKPYIRKITLFKSKGRIKYTQKLMPSCYSCFSYNLENIPQFIVEKQTIMVQSRAQFAGPKTLSDIKVNHSGITNQLLFEFTAIGYYELLGISPANIKNSLAVAELPCLKIIECEKDAEIISDKIQACFIKQIPESKLADCRICKAILEMERLNGLISVKEACSIANVGDRHFNRLFIDITGCSPKLYLKILQLHSIIISMSSEKQSMMTDIAYSSGYYDQAHFNKRFKDLVKMTPKEFLRSSEHVSFQYFKKENINN